MPHPNRTLTVYEPTKRGVPPLVPYVKEIWSRRALVWHLARTAMKARHYDTVMGKAWVIIDPIVLAATFYLVRIVFRPSATAEDAGFFIAHIIMGVSVFFYVRNISEGSSRCILGNKSMVLNTSAPRGVFPAVVLTRSAIDLVPTMIVYFGVHFLAGQPWGLPLVLLPFAFILLTIFALGLGLFLAPMVVFYRDTATLIPYVMRIWLYVTPVMYAVGEIPQAVRPFLALNPLFPFFVILEDIFKAEWPPTSAWLWSAAWAAGALAVGSFAFLRKERDYAVRL